MRPETSLPLDRSTESTDFAEREQLDTDVLRRRQEAADVLAETLLDLWLAERRTQRQAQARTQGQPPGGGSRD